MEHGVARWAEEEFGRASVHGAQRKQLVRVASQLAERPHGLISQSMRTDADRQSAYGLLEGDGVSADALADAQNVAAVLRASHYETPFVPIDGSAVNVTDRQKNKGTGRIGSPPSAARGLKVMSAIVVSPGRTPLGVVAQDYWTREERPHRKNHATRPFEQRETFHWVGIALAAVALFAKYAPNSRPWFQVDREGDFTEMLKLAIASSLLITIRANHDRSSGKNGVHRLWATLRRKRSIGNYLLHVEPGPNRPGRDAEIVVRACEVMLWVGKRAKKECLRVQAVHAIEKNPLRGAKRIEWLLLTTHPVTTFEEAKRVIDGYAARWSIEEFHRTWKSGLCNVEKMQLRSREALQKHAILLASVAMRAARLTHLARESPDLPASAEFDDTEIEAIIALRQPRNYDSRTTLTLGQAVRWIADIGGYVGNKSSGPPGKIVIGRGLIEVEIAARALRNVAARKS